MVFLGSTHGSNSDHGQEGLNGKQLIYILVLLQYSTIKFKSKALVDMEKCLFMFIVFIL